MIVKLIPEKVIENAYNEEQLLDLSVIESLYVIRSLKACIKSEQENGINITQFNQHGQAYSKEFSIWFKQNEYEFI